jgi:hypothetical protein
VNLYLQEVLDLEFELLHVGHAAVNEEDDGVALCLGSQNGLGLHFFFKWVE